MAPHPSPLPACGARESSSLRPAQNCDSELACSVAPSPRFNGERAGVRGYSVHCRSSLPSANRIALWQAMDRVGTTGFMIFLHARLPPESGKANAWSPRQCNHMVTRSRVISSLVNHLLKISRNRHTAGHYARIEASVTATICSPQSFSASGAVSFRAKIVDKVCRFDR